MSNFGSKWHLNVIVGLNSGTRRKRNSQACYYNVSEVVYNFSAMYKFSESYLNDGCVYEATIMASFDNFLSKN